jgi:hypothetical protein
MLLFKTMVLILSLNKLIVLLSLTIRLAVGFFRDYSHADQDASDEETPDLTDDLEQPLRGR